MGRFAHHRRLDRRTRGGANINTAANLVFGEAVQNRIRNQVAIKLDGARGVVVAGDREGDLVGVAIGIDDRHDRYAEFSSLFDGDGFLVGVDHKHEVGHPAH